MDLQEQLQRAFVELGLARPGLGVEPKTTDKAISLARGAIYAAQQALAAPQPSQGAMTFKDAVLIARGCTDYGGGYRSDPQAFEAYQAGIQTVITALERADLQDYQTRALHCMGAAPHQPVSAEAGKGVEQTAADVRAIHERMKVELAEGEPVSEEIAAMLGETLAFLRDPAVYRGKHWGSMTNEQRKRAFTKLDGGAAGYRRKLWTWKHFDMGAEDIGKRPSESVAVSGEVLDDAIERIVQQLDATNPRWTWKQFARAVLALAGSAKQAAALERMARLDDEMGEEP